MSETSPVTHVNPLYGMRKIGSIGTLRVQHRREDRGRRGRRRLGVGEEGELLVRGPQVMQGYWNREEEARRRSRRLDAHGRPRLHGRGRLLPGLRRKKDMINCSGLKVFPDEVDEVLMPRRAILEAATIGVPDPARGETVKSFIVLNEGASLTEEEVESAAREQLAAYKIPRKVQFMDELPKARSTEDPAPGLERHGGEEEGRLSRPANARAARRLSLQRPGAASSFRPGVALAPGGAAHGAARPLARAPAAVIKGRDPALGEHRVGAASSARPVLQRDRLHRVTKTQLRPAVR